MTALVAGLAFLAGMLVGACALAGVACWRMSGRRGYVADTRPFDDRRPEERR